MSLEALVDEIRSHADAEVARIERERSREEAEILADRDRRIAALRTEKSAAARAEAARVRTQRVAAAKFTARKQLYEARERWLERALASARDLESDYVGSDRYAGTLRRMVSAATEALGKQVRISGRAEDASLLAKIAGKSFDPSPRSIRGGLLAETPDGRRRLNLSLEELLRLREDRVRELLSK